MLSKKLVGLAQRQTAVVATHKRAQRAPRASVVAANVSVKTIQQFRAIHASAKSLSQETKGPRVLTPDDIAAYNPNEDITDADLVDRDEDIEYGEEGLELDANEVALKEAMEEDLAENDEFDEEFDEEEDDGPRQESYFRGDAEDALGTNQRTAVPYKDYFVSETGDITVELKKGNAKLSAMLKAGKNLDVIDEFNAMADDHHPRDATTFEIAMTAFNNEDGWKETILLWNEAPLIGVEPTGNMYAHYMHALFKSRRIEDMVAAFQDMVAAGVPRTAPVYTVLIEFYAEKGSLAGVLEAEKKMADDKITPDVPLFNALLDFYIKTGRQDDAFNVIQRMQNQGVELGVVPLAVIAERDISKGDIAAATKTMTRIQRELVARVPQFVYDALISHYLTKDDTTNAEKVLGQLRDAGYKVGVATARHFVTYYAARIDAARVSFYLQELRAANKRPDRKLCQAVLTMQFTRRALGEFKTIMTEMLDRKMKIDRIHWTQYLDLVARESEDIAAVDSTFDYVKQRGIVLDQSDYTLLLDSYCRFDRPELAVDLREELKQCNMDWTASDLAKIAKTFNRVKNYARAAELFFEFDAQHPGKAEAAFYVEAFHALSHLNNEAAIDSLWQKTSKVLATIRGLQGDHLAAILTDLGEAYDVPALRKSFQVMMQSVPKLVTIDVYNSILARIALTGSLAETTEFYQFITKSTKPDYATYLYIGKAASMAGSAGLALGLRVFNDATASAPQTPLRATLAYVGLIHLLRNGSHATFPEVLQHFKKLTQRGMGLFVADADAAALQAAFKSTLTADKVVPAKPIERSLDALFGKPAPSIVQQLTM